MLPENFHESFLKVPNVWVKSMTRSFLGRLQEQFQTLFRKLWGTFQELFRKLSESYWKLHVVCGNFPVVFPERMQEAYKNTSYKTSASIYVRLRMDLLELSIKLPWQLLGSAQCLGQIHDKNFIGRLQELFKTLFWKLFRKFSKKVTGS